MSIVQVQSHSANKEEKGNSRDGAREKKPDTGHRSNDPLSRDEELSFQIKRHDNYSISLEG